MQCRPSTQLRLDLTESNANGLVIAFDIFVLESQKHTLFSFRNKGNLAMGFTLEIFYDYSVQLWQDTGGGSWENPITTTTTLTPSKSNFVCLIADFHDKIDAWNRVIMEIVQAHPYAFTTGYYSGRIWINGVDMNRVYFGDFTTGHLFSDMNTGQITLCSTTSDGTNSMGTGGNYDLLNFMWFKGSEGLYVPTGGKLWLIWYLILNFLSRIVPIQ